MLASRGTWAASAAVGAIALAVYVRTLYPGVAGGDSGELIGAVVTGGVIHPPGYPLYALLGTAFVWGAGAGAAFRLNLLCALSDAAAAALVCAAVARKGGSAWAGATAGMLFAFAPGVWAYAICAEVFALNNLAAAALLYLAVRFDDSEDLRDAALFGFVAGLGLANHHTILFVAVPLGAWMSWRARAPLRRHPKWSVAVVGAGAAGLLPYLYLPIASARSAAVSWGDARTLSGFFTHVLRREYGTFQLAPDGLAADASALAKVSAWAGDLVSALGVWALPLLVVGVVVCARAAPPRVDRLLLVVPALAVAVMSLLGNVPVTDALHRGIFARFWQEPDLFLCAAVGLGAARVERFFTASAHAPWLARGAAVVPVFLATLGGVLRYPEMDRHASTLVRSYGAEVLRAAPPRALLVTRGDLITNSVRYLQSVEKMRPDVRVVDLELLGFPWSRGRLAALYPDVRIPGPRYMPGASDGFALVDLLDANAGRFPVLSCGGAKPGDRSADVRYGNWPFGLCELVRSGSEPVDVQAWIRESDAALPRIDFTGQPRPEGSWEEIVWKDYWEVRQARAAHLLELAGADPARRRFIEVAADILSRLVEENPDLAPHVYKNLALALGRAGRLETAEQRTLAASAWRRYLASNPENDPQLPLIRAELRRLESTP